MQRRRRKHLKYVATLESRLSGYGTVKIALEFNDDYASIDCTI
jgi:hypothetical protein